MLACARIGAVHSVVFGGFSAESLRDRINDAHRHRPHHRRRRLPAGPDAPAQAHRRRGGRGLPQHPARGGCPPRLPDRRRRVLRRDDRGSRPLVAPPAGQGEPRLPSRGDGRRGPALHPLHLGHHREAEGHRAHHRRLPHPGDSHHEVRLRPAGRGHLLVHRRRGLGDGAFVRRVRPAGQWRHRADVRGSARLAGTRPVLEDHRAPWSDGVLHRTHRHPRLHEMGDGAPRRARPLHPPPARQRRRADQPRGVDVVSRAHRPGDAAPSWTPGGRRKPAGS